MTTSHAAQQPATNDETYAAWCRTPEPDSEVAGLVGFHHKFANLNDARIHYVVGGEGPAVVLLHGWPYTWAEWRKLMPLLADAGFTVIAPDLRGLGHSEKTETGYSKVNVAEGTSGRSCRPTGSTRSTSSAPTSG